MEGSFGVTPTMDLELLRGIVMVPPNMHFSDNYRMDHW